MACISTDCDLISHVKTQMPYALLVGGFALFIGYLPVALGSPLIFSFAGALALTIALFYLVKWRHAACREAA